MICAECYEYNSVTLLRMLHYITVPVTHFQQNCSIIWCDEAKLAAIVDPGGDIDKLLAAVKKTGAHLEQIWLTHAHIDHAGATAELNRAFVGDVLFAGSIGRTDFPRGNHADLIASITQRLWPYGNDTVFIPGHGPESTFGAERQSNPYVGGT